MKVYYIAMQKDNKHNGLWVGAEFSLKNAKKKAYKMFPDSTNISFWSSGSLFTHFVYVWPIFSYKQERGKK